MTDVCGLLPPSGICRSGVWPSSLLFVFLQQREATQQGVSPSAWRVAAFIILQVIGGSHESACMMQKWERSSKLSGSRGRSYSLLLRVCGGIKGGRFKLVCATECHRGSSPGGSREDESCLSSLPSSAAIQNRHKHFSSMRNPTGGKYSGVLKPQSVARCRHGPSGVRPVRSHKWASVRLCCGFCLIGLRIDRHKPELVPLPSSRLPGRRVRLHAI